MKPIETFSDLLNFGYVGVIVSNQQSGIRIQTNSLVWTSAGPNCFEQRRNINHSNISGFYCRYDFGNFYASEEKIGGKSNKKKIMEVKSKRAKKLTGILPKDIKIYATQHELLKEHLRKIVTKHLLQISNLPMHKELKKYPPVSKQDLEKQVTKRCKHTKIPKSMYKEREIIDTTELDNLISKYGKDNVPLDQVKPLACTECELPVYCYHYYTDREDIGVNVNGNIFCVICREYITSEITTEFSWLSKLSSFPKTEINDIYLQSAAIGLINFKMFDESVFNTTLDRQEMINVFTNSKMYDYGISLLDEIDLDKFSSSRLLNQRKNKMAILIVAIYLWLIKDNQSGIKFAIPKPDNVIDYLISVFIYDYIKSSVINTAEDRAKCIEHAKNNLPEYLETEQGREIVMYVCNNMRNLFIEDGIFINFENKEILTFQQLMSIPYIEFIEPLLSRTLDVNDVVGIQINLPAFKKDLDSRLLVNVKKTLRYFKNVLTDESMKVLKKLTDKVDIGDSDTHDATHHKKRKLNILRNEDSHYWTVPGVVNKSNQVYTVEKHKEQISPTIDATHLQEMFIKAAITKRVYASENKKLIAALESNDLKTLADSKELGAVMTALSNYFIGNKVEVHDNTADYDTEIIDSYNDIKTETEWVDADMYADEDEDDLEADDRA